MSEYTLKIVMTNAGKSRLLELVNESFDKFLTEATKTDSGFITAIRPDDNAQS